MNFYLAPAGLGFELILPVDQSKVKKQYEKLKIKEKKKLVYCTLPIGFLRSASSALGSSCRTLGM
jgi:hypothetical protein